MVLIWAALAVLGILAGCVTDRRLQSSNAGKSVAFFPGTPDFDFEAVETVRGGESGVDLYVRVPWSSLVFVHDTAGFEARYELRARFLPDTGSSGSVDQSWDRSVRSDRTVDRYSSEEQLVVQRVVLEEGKYVAEVVLEDLHSGVEAVRRQEIMVFNAGDSCARILRITLDRKVHGLAAPFLPLHIPVGQDSLRAVVTLRYPRLGAGNGLHLLVLRYPTDSLPAMPPYYLTPMAWSIRRTGVDFRKADTLARRVVPFTDDVEQTLSISLMGLTPGFHEVIARCSTRACGEAEGDRILERSRGLVIVDRDFPRITTRRGLVEPLLYLATEREYHEILEAGNEEEIRKRFEKFWLHLGGTPERAANLIKQFYTRVEDANLQYSAYKEGWKTDRGMIHVVFGTPALVERRPRQEVWTYSSGDVFLFEFVNPTRFDEPVENWTLARDSYNEQAWVKEVERWRRGQAF
jgi:GWxTD domain-containing protein